MAAAAYRSGEKLRDRKTKTTHDYRRKHGVLWSEIIDANGQTVTTELREVLWNAAEASERRKDSRMAREIECAIPTELTPQQYSRLIREFVQALQAWEFAGSACDYAIHDKGDGNPHVHMLFTKHGNRRPFMLLLRSQTFCSSSRFTFARVSVIHSANQ